MATHFESSLTRSRLPAELQSGFASAVSLCVDSITLANGERVNLPASGVTAIVGANNAGKSTFINQIVTLISRDSGAESHNWRLIESIELMHEGDGADLVSWLDENFRFRSQGNQAGFINPTHQQPLPLDALPSLWALNDRMGRLSSFFAYRNDPFQRMNALAPSARRELSEQSDHPFHRLEDDPEVMEEFSALSEKYFRTPLTLDWLSGNIQVRMGRVSIEPPRVDKVTPEYRQAVASLPLLHEQGDGMRSFMGLLLSLVTAAYPILLVDEPEAFLHPPQAFALGYELGRLSKKSDVQLILATHDRSMLTGLLEADVDVSVIRLDRTGDVTKAHQIDAAELRSVWADSVLRYSNVLDGLFHKLVVIAEADRDCRFYAAALNEADREEPLPIPPSDVLFVPSGGKDGIVKLASALQAAHVPVVTTPDMDILNEKKKIQTLVRCMGGEEAWESIDKLYSIATNAFDQPRRQASCEDVLTGINAVLSGKLSEPYSPQVKKAVAAQLRTYESPWQDLKHYGQLAFAKHGGGQSSAAATKLLNDLDAMGIFLVRVGELERFAPDLDVAKGVEWLPAALRAGAHRSREALRHVRSFLAAVT